MSCKVGIAFGGGGARGIAHLGVCQRLAELGVRVHCIAGTSIGAIVGAIVSAGNADRAAHTIVCDGLVYLQRLAIGIAQCEMLVGLFLLNLHDLSHCFYYS